MYDTRFMALIAVIAHSHAGFSALTSVSSTPTFSAFREQVAGMRRHSCTASTRWAPPTIQDDCGTLRRREVRHADDGTYSALGASIRGAGDAGGRAGGLRATRWLCAAQRQKRRPYVYTCHQFVTNPSIGSFHHWDVAVQLHASGRQERHHLYHLPDTGSHNGPPKSTSCWPARLCAATRSGESDVHRDDWR